MFEDPARENEEIPLFAGETPFSFSSKDLSMIEHIPEIVDSGIDSLKIEGRMKSVHYVATVVNAYRQAIDAYCADPDGYELKKEWVEEIHKAAHRSTTTGFFFDIPSSEDHLYEEAEPLSEYEFCGVVLDYDANEQIATIEQRNHFAVGQTVEFFGPGGRFFRQTIREMRDEKGTPIEKAPHPLMIARVKVDQPLKKWDLMRKQMK